MIYFGAQPTPATKWSHFDPGLHNSYEIRLEMIYELQVNSALEAVLDPEFDRINEPNDSPRRRGVTLLDEYIRRAYRPAQTFDDMSVWQRRE